MTAAEYQAEAASLAQQTAEYQSAAAQHQLLGMVFDHAAPLPTLRTHKTRREWETEQDTK